MTPDHPKSQSPATALAAESGDPALEPRLLELETRLAHLSRFVEELNEVVTEQATRIERLEREYAHLRCRAGFTPSGGFGTLGTPSGSGPGDPQTP